MHHKNYIDGMNKLNYLYGWNQPFGLEYIMKRLVFILIYSMHQRVKSALIFLVAVRLTLSY